MTLKGLLRRLLRVVMGGYDPNRADGRAIVWAYRLLLDRNPESRAVVEILRDGTRNPYLIWRAFRGWRPDTQEEGGTP